MRNFKTILFVSTIVMTLAMTAYAETKNVSGKVWFSIDASTYVVESDSQFVYINKNAISESARNEMSLIGKNISVEVPTSAIFAYDKTEEQVSLSSRALEDQPMSRLEGDKLVLRGTRIGDHGEEFPSIQVGDFIYRIDPATLDTKTQAELTKIGQFVEVKVLGNAVRFAYKLPSDKVTAEVPETSGIVRQGNDLSITGFASYSFNSEQYVITVRDQVYRFDKDLLSATDMKKFDKVGSEINVRIPSKVLNGGSNVRMPAGAR